jgi:hypothetical protein
MALNDERPFDRAAQRTRTLLQARIEFNNGSTTVECTVRDLSEFGARLQVPQSAVVPPNFVLFVPKHGRRYHAQLRWHRDGYIGAAFEAHAGGGEAPEGEREEDGRVAKLEAEIARLRRVIESIRADPSQARLLVERFDLTVNL